MPGRSSSGSARCSAGGSFLELRSAVAWGSVPTIWIGLLWIPELLIFGEEMFTSDMPSVEGSPARAWLLIGFGALQIVGGVWSFVVGLKCVGEAHRFSVWKALLTVILAALLIILPIVLMVVLALALSM